VNEVARRPTAQHLAAFSSLLASDNEAGKLNQRDLQLLALLVVHDTPMSVGQIATMVSLSPSHAGRVIDKLVTRKLIERISGADRRTAQLRPTAAGRALDARVRRHFEASARQG
jgi:DNA-binding MarR family transcriptional regulator